MNRRIYKKGGTLLALLVILTMILSGCGSFFGEEDILVETEEQLKPEILLDVAEMEFGHMMIYQFQVQEVKGLTGAERIVLLRTDEAKGIVAEMTEPLYAMDLMGEVTLAVLTDKNRILAKTVIPTGTYQKVFDLYLSHDEVTVRDTSIVLTEQSLVGTYLADGVLPYTGEEGDIEQNIVLRMAGDGEIDLDYNYFVINDIAIEFNYAFDESSRFNVLFSEKFSEVDYVFDDLDLYIHHNNTMIDAKTGNEVTDVQEIELSIVKIYNATYRNGRQRATANVVYSARQDIGQITVFTVNVTEVTGLRRATGFTILEPQESFTSFGTEITRSTDSNQIFFYILGGDTDDFAGGNGTAQFPYLIANAEHFNNMRYYMEPNTHFQLTADIDLRELDEDLESISLQQEGAWTPIGSYSNPFEGHFDGSGYVISNLEIERLDRVDVGLFGYIGASGEIEGLFLENVTVVGQRQVGALVGRNRGTITDCEVRNGSVTGLEFVGGIAGVNYERGHIINSTTRDISVTGDAEGNRSGNFVGGLVGANSSDAIIDDSIARGPVFGVDNVGGLAGSNDTFAEIRGSSATGAVTGSGENVGGLVGLNSGSDIERSHATGEVNGGGLYVGGLVGLNEDGSRIDLSYATGSVTGAHNTVGGLVGMNWDGDIEESYATGHVRGVTNIGGLVGVNWERGTIEDSYATGNVTGSGNRIGGLVGRNDHTIDSSYYAGGTVQGLDNVGLFIGVNWYDGEITGSHASGQSIGNFIGDNRNEEFEILPFDINDYFSTDSAAVARLAGDTQFRLDKAPADNATLFIAPAWTPVGDLIAGGDNISSLTGDNKTRWVELPIGTGDNYKIILVDDNDNKIESSATLKIQNVDDVLYYDDDEPALDQDYRSARFGHRFTLDLGPVEGVTVWIAPEGTNRFMLDESKGDMTRLEGSRSLRRNIDAPDKLGTDYKVVLMDAYNNHVESRNYIVIGNIANENIGAYFVTLANVIDFDDTDTGHVIRLYSDYTLDSWDLTAAAIENPIVTALNNTEDPLNVNKSLVIDLNRNKLNFDGNEIDFTVNNSKMMNGRVGDNAIIDVNARNVEINDVEFERTLTLDVLTADTVSIDSPIFKGNVTLVPAGAGTVELFNVTLGRNVTLDGDDKDRTFFAGELLIESNTVRIIEVTFEGDITVTGNNTVFEDVRFDPNIVVYGNSRLTVEDGTGTDTEFGNDMAFFDVTFDLTNDMTIGGSNIYMMRCEFETATGAPFEILNITGANFYAELALFTDDVEINAAPNRTPVFANSTFDGELENDGDAIYVDSTFNDDVENDGDAIYVGSTFNGEVENVNGAATYEDSVFNDDVTNTAGDASYINVRFNGDFDLAGGNVTFIDVSFDVTAFNVTTTNNAGNTDIDVVTVNPAFIGLRDEDVELRFGREIGGVPAGTLQDIAAWDSNLTIDCDLTDIGGGVYDINFDPTANVDNTTVTVYILGVRVDTVPFSVTP